jgi:hypothetical protein
MNNSAFATLQRFNKALLCICYIYFTKAGPVNSNEQRKNLYWRFKFPVVLL